MLPCPTGAPSPSPGLAHPRLSWECPSEFAQPQRGCVIPTTSLGHNPVGVAAFVSSRTQGSRSDSTLDDRTQSRWDRFVRRAPAWMVALGLLITGCAGPFEVRKTKWTVPEVREWYAGYRRSEPRAWNGIRYEGSDARWHHFIARVPSVDNWAIIQIRREDLTVPLELPHARVSSNRNDYYFVDPANGFSRIQEAQSNVPTP